jgi:DNA (cytosine-5)-methyltransferase 1
VADADSSTGGQRRADVRGRAHADHERFNGQHPLLQREESGRIKRHSMEIAGGGESSGLADANSQPAGRDGRSPHPAEDKIHGAGPSNDYRPAHDGGTGRPGPTNGYWAAADWLGCRDGKWRPVEPGTFPLAHGAAARVGRLRAYGNAINAQAARAFLEILKECAP